MLSCNSSCYLYHFFISGETDSSKFWDSKTRGANGGQKGELLWDLDAVSHCFTDRKRFINITWLKGDNAFWSVPV